MNLNRYLQFCRKFRETPLPKIKFKNINVRCQHVIERVYNVREEELNKATFIVFIISFTLSFLILFLVIRTGFVLYPLISLILAFIISYFFNIRLIKVIKNEELKLDATLYLIKIIVSLYSTALEKTHDAATKFITLMANLNLDFSDHFKKYLSKTQIGDSPESLLKTIVTPSKDFNLFIKNLLINDFEYQYNLNEIGENSLENKFKIYLKQIETKLSLFFFIGIFVPLTLSLLILFQRMNPLILLSIVPLFFLLMRQLHRNFIKSNQSLFGILNESSKHKRKIFQEFLLFIRSLALNLKKECVVGIK